MSTHSGLAYYYDLLGLDPDSFRLHYRFDEQNATTIPNSAPLYPQVSGSSNTSTSGNFTNTRVNISGATGIALDEWTHLFMLDRKSSSRAVIYDSLQSGSRWSGYRIGLNDNNQPFLECWGASGPLCVVANLPSASKNIYGVVKSNNLVTFYNYDFYNQKSNSSSHALDGSLFPYSSFATIGSGRNLGGYFVTGNLSGIVEDYVILADSLSPQAFKLLCSGLVSDYSTMSGSVSSFSGIEITGNTTGTTGTTGIIRYETVVTGSGLNPFGTGDYVYQYGPTGITGYLSSGLSITPATGYVVRYITGAQTSGIATNTSLVDTFRHNELSILTQYDSNDYLVSNYNWNAVSRNLEGEFDDVNSAFSLPEEEDERFLPVYINGILQLATGYTITGDAYASGVVLSGDFRLDGRLVDSTGFYSLSDVLFYDRATKTALSLTASSMESGTSLAIPASGELYFNGVLLNSGYDYTGGSSTTIITSRLNGATGKLVYWPLESGDAIKTGASTTSGSFWRGAQKVWMNGVRLSDNKDYMENCNLDLIAASGTITSPEFELFSNSELYFNV
jgi:hypothetical protein